VEWLKQFEGSSSKSVPLLVCLTFGDRLFVECQEDQGGYHPEHMKKAIATELKVTFLNNTLTIMLCLQHCSYRLQQLWDWLVVGVVK